MCAIFIDHIVCPREKNRVNVNERKSRRKIYRARKEKKIKWTHKSTLEKNKFIHVYVYL